MMESCERGQKYRLQNPEPLLPPPGPEGPWQKVGIDLFEWPKKQYILILDVFSRSAGIPKFKQTSAEVTIKAAKEASE